MKVLIACECTGAVRDAFIARGHDAVSFDLKPSARPGPHIQGSIFNLLPATDYDLFVGFPPCTHLAVSGAKHFKGKVESGVQQIAIGFFMRMVNNGCARWCLENPIGIMSTHYRKPNQTIEPWMFGDPFEKPTCLWLRGLPRLNATDPLLWQAGINSRKSNVPVDKGKRVTFSSGKTMASWINLPPGEERGDIRSKTFPGLAKAMAEQWG